MSRIRVSVLAAAERIKSELRKDEKFSQGVRLYAVYQVALGKTAKELEGLYSCSHKSICNWVHRYNSEGAAGLKDRPRGGRRSRLSEAQKEAIKTAILHSPEAAGFPSGVWTWALVARYIAKTFGVAYKKAQVYNILHSLGLSYQKGRGYFPEQEGREPAVAALKKNFRRGSRKA
jgi:transposase